MNDTKIDGRLQVTAAISLIEFSRLLQWESCLARFAPVPHDEFESACQSDIDQTFGRLICWITFSAGAEFLAKGACLLHGVGIHEQRPVPLHPRSGMDLSEWARRFNRNWRHAGTVDTTYFGTLGNLTEGPNAPLKQLFAILDPPDEDTELVLAAYKLLTRAIRNRDAHAYVPNVRDDHFSLVPDLFTKSFNLLLSWLPIDPQTLNEWREEAPQFISCL
jgi:hypothetical protein